MLNIKITVFASSFKNLENVGYACPRSGNYGMHYSAIVLNVINEFYRLVYTALGRYIYVPSVQSYRFICG